MHLKAPNSINRRPTRTRPFSVNFPIPKRAISKLRSLAIGKDPRLLDLGVLAVQISDDENIVLGIDLEKHKRKGPVNSRSIPPSSASYSSGSFAGFQPFSRNFQTSTPGYLNQFGTSAPRTETLPTLSRMNRKSLQNTATKKRAKETLNAARRGGIKARSRAGKNSLHPQPVTAKASTWEMVYSHLGVPGEQSRKQSNPPHLEPVAASPACGVANVPVAQPTLPKDNLTKGDSKRRESACKSPPYKTPVAGSAAIYSEDDSSVSSSPCSHSPMNEEELLNLFVDQNFSATSILKQLAESRNKEDEKNSDVDKVEQKVTNQSSTIYQEASSLSTNLLLQQDDNSKTDTSASAAVESQSSISSNLCAEEDMYHTKSACTSSNNSTTSAISLNNPFLKRPNISDNSNCSMSWYNLFESQAKRQKKSLPELDTKKEMIDQSCKISEQHPQGGIQPSTLTRQTRDAQLQATSSNQPVAKTTSQTEALRNFSQYGYYYTAEELKALGTKALASKSTNRGSSKANKNETVQPQSSNTFPSTLTNNGHVLNKRENLPLQVKPSESQKQDYSSTISISNQNESLPISKESFNLSNLNEEKKENTSKNETSSDTENICLSLNTGKVKQETLSLPNLPADSSTGEATSLVSSSFSTMVTTKADSTPPIHGDNINKKAGGQCYALSYVYPMGTVWYPYVAITPYAVLGDSQKSKSECNSSGKENAIEGLNQYIDLASSMRYWQQLSLLYKNKLLASTPSIANLLPGQDKNAFINSVVASSSTASTSGSMIEEHTGSPSTVTKPRRASVIVTTTEYNKDDRASATSTPESTTSTESIVSCGSKSDAPTVIDNCNRLIEEHCHRMSEVFTMAVQDSTFADSSSNDTRSGVPSLSFIPDSSIAYVNIGNNSIQGTRKSGFNGKECKGKAKKRKSSKNV